MTEHFLRIPTYLYNQEQYQLSHPAIYTIAVLIEEARQTCCSVLEFTQAALGARIGRTRKMVGRYLQELESAGLLEINRKGGRMRSVTVTVPVITSFYMLPESFDEKALSIIEKLVAAQVLSKGRLSQKNNNTTSEEADEAVFFYTIDEAAETADICHTTAVKSLKKLTKEQVIDRVSRSKRKASITLMKVSNLKASSPKVKNVSGTKTKLPSEFPMPEDLRMGLKEDTAEPMAEIEMGKKCTNERGTWVIFKLLKTAYKEICTLKGIRVFSRSSCAGAWKKGLIHMGKKWSQYRVYKKIVNKKENHTYSISIKRSRGGEKTRAPDG